MIAHAPEKIFNTNYSFFGGCYNLIIKLKRKKLQEENKVKKTACLKNALYVKGIFQYNVTHDVSVYAIRGRNGYQTLPVLIC